MLLNEKHNNYHKLRVFAAFQKISDECKAQLHTCNMKFVFLAANDILNVLYFKISRFSAKG